MSTNIANNGYAFISDAVQEPEILQPPTGRPSSNSAENIRDTIAEALVAGENIAIAIDDNANTITVTASGEITAQSAYLHTQVTETATWVVPHNLGHYPYVAVTDSTNHLAFAEVFHLTTDTLEVRFSTPQTGLARCI